MTFGNYILMNMTMMTIKGRKAVICLLLLPVLILLIYFCAGKMGNLHKRQLELQTIQSGNGWGYQIVMDDKIVIYQPTVPAIDTLMAFPSEYSARLLGQLVLKRMKSKENFSVSREEAIHSLSQ